MTYYREPGQLEAALFNVLRQLSPADVEAATGKTVKALEPAHYIGHPASLHLKDAAGLDAMLISLGRRSVFGPIYARMVEEKLEELTGKPTAPDNITSLRDDGDAA